MKTYIALKKSLRTKNFVPERKRHLGMTMLEAKTEESLTKKKYYY